MITCLFALHFTKSHLLPLFPVGMHECFKILLVTLITCCHLELPYRFILLLQINPDINLQYPLFSSSRVLQYPLTPFLPMIQFPVTFINPLCIFVIAVCTKASMGQNVILFYFICVTAFSKDPSLFVMKVRIFTSVFLYLPYWNLLFCYVLRIKEN